MLVAECASCGRVLSGGYHSELALQAAMIEREWLPSLENPRCPACRPQIDVDETYTIRGDIRATYWHSSHRIVRRRQRNHETLDLTACDKWIKVTLEAIEIHLSVTSCPDCRARDLAANGRPGGDDS